MGTIRVGSAHHRQRRCAGIIVRSGEGVQDEGYNLKVESIGSAGLGVDALGVHDGLRIILLRGLLGVFS